MKELEDALGFSLLNRSTHGIMLTDAGEGLLQNCLQMLAKLDGYVVDTRNLQKGPYGTLRVLATSEYAEYVLTPLLPKFVKRAPVLLDADRAAAFAGPISRRARPTVGRDRQLQFRGRGIRRLRHQQEAVPAGAHRQRPGTDQARRVRVAEIFPALRPAEEAAGPA